MGFVAPSAHHHIMQCNLEAQALAGCTWQLSLPTPCSLALNSALHLPPRPPRACGSVVTVTAATPLHRWLIWWPAELFFSLQSYPIVHSI